jgi:excisionase family DNA binding protein
MSQDRQATDDVAADEQMLTAKQVASRLNVHVSTVYRLRDRLNGQKFGTGQVRARGFRVPESKVNEFKNGNRAA